MQKFRHFPQPPQNFWLFKSTAYVFLTVLNFGVHHSTTWCPTWFVTMPINSYTPNVISATIQTFSRKVFIRTNTSRVPEILNETCLPPREKLYSELNEGGILEEQYDRALEMWRRYECKTLKDYHGLYLTVDVTLLADVFENLRNMALRVYKLDPTHFWTVPDFG